MVALSMKHFQRRINLHYPISLRALFLIIALLLNPNYVVAQETAKSYSLQLEYAEQWLAMIDAGHYAKSWFQTTDSFQDRVSQNDWVSALQFVRAPLGDIKNRKLLFNQKKQTINKLPEGNYHVLTLAATYQGQKKTKETITLIEEQGKYRIVSYNIY